MKTKKSMTFRLSETTAKELAELSQTYGISQADAIAIAVHLAFIEKHTSAKFSEWAMLA